MKNSLKKVFYKALYSVRPVLNLRADMSVKGLSGVAWLGCTGGAIYQVGTGNQNKDITKGCLVGAPVFAAIYLYLDNRDAKRQQCEFQHQETVARIKHSGAKGNALKEEPESEVVKPAYLKPFDKAPSVASLNDLATAQGQDLHPLVSKYLYEGELSIFVSMANKGKTIVAVQMAIDLANGESTIFNMETPPRKQTVWYYNFEMSAPQMKKRLTGKDGTTVKFPENVLMINCKGCYEDVDSFLNALALDAETKITGNTVVFIDTITNLCPQFFSKEVSYVLRSLSTIQEHVRRSKGFSLTIVIESHTTKINDSEPLGFDNMKGGVNQSNLTDSIFALGVAHGKKGYRYMKNLKLRNDEQPDEVDVIEISRSSYVRPHFVKTAKEEDVLPPRKKPTGKGVGTDEVADGKRSISDEWDGKLSLEQTLEMKKFYKEGEKGRGLGPTANKFGLKFPNDVSRELQKIEKFLETHPDFRAEDL